MDPEYYNPNKLHDAQSNCENKREEAYVHFTTNLYINIQITFIASISGRVHPEHWLIASIMPIKRKPDSRGLQMSWLNLEIQYLSLQKNF